MRLRKPQLNRTYVSGHWMLADSPKNPVEHYYKLIPKTLDMLAESRLVFFYEDPALLRFVEKNAQDKNVDLVPVKRSIEELPARDLSEGFAASCERMGLDAFPEPEHKNKEKGVIHYWRDWKRGGPAFYKDLLSIWLSKVSLVCEAIDQLGDRGQCGYFAWADVSVARFSKKRRNWDFPRVRLPDEKVSCYKSDMQYFGGALPVSASFLGGGEAVWQELEERFLMKARGSLAAAYAHDEETILSAVYRDDPGFFYRFGGAPRYKEAGSIMGLFLNMPRG